MYSLILFYFIILLFINIIYNTSRETIRWNTPIATRSCHFCLTNRHPRPQGLSPDVKVASAY